MNELQTVNLNQAILLEKLGFDWACNEVFEDTSNPVCKDCIHCSISKSGYHFDCLKKSSDDPDRWIHKRKLKTHYCSDFVRKRTRRPTIALALKWCHEKINGSITDYENQERLLLDSLLKKFLRREI